MTLLGTLSAETEKQAECNEICNDQFEECFDDCTETSGGDRDCQECYTQLSGCQKRCKDPKVKN